MTQLNQSPEQKARENIDRMLEASGWKVQHKNAINFDAGLGIAVREYQTDVGPADYVLFVDKEPVGVIEAKPENWGQNITTVEEQSAGYAEATLKWINNKERLPFVYESTGVITRFTDGRDPKPRSREVFSFHRLETLKEWLTHSASPRGRLQLIPPLNHAGLEAALERGQGQARQYQQARRSLPAQPVHRWRTRRHSLCQDPRHPASALAYGIVSAEADQGRRHRPRQQDRQDGLGHDGQGRAL